MFCFLIFRTNNFTPQHGQEEPNVNISGEIPDSELVLEATKVEQKYEKQQEQRRFVLKINVIVKTNRPQFSMVYTLIDHRNDAIKCSKLCSKTTRRFTRVMNILSRLYVVFSMVYTLKDHSSRPLSARGFT